MFARGPTWNKMFRRCLQDLYLEFDRKVAFTVIHETIYSYNFKHFIEEQKANGKKIGTTFLATQMFLSRHILEVAIKKQVLASKLNIDCRVHPNGS